MIDAPTLNNYHSAIQEVCIEVNQRFALQDYIPNAPILKRMLRNAGIEEHMLDQAVETVLKETGKTIEQ